MSFNQKSFALIALSFSIATGSMAQTFRPEIVGGTTVSDQSTVPFLVQLHDQNGVECGGSVIAPTWILTAGHCEEVVTSVTILGGSLTSGSGTKLAIKNHFRDPEFKETATGVTHDFMLIQLAAPITDPNIQPIALADPTFANSGLQDPGQMMTVAGWGDLKSGAGKYPKTANQVQVPIVDQTIANGPQSYDGALDDSSLAAGYAKGGKDACDGDSGGPLFTFDASQNKNVLVGVVSFGDGCAQANKYGIYAKVSEGYAWITQTMSENTSDDSDDSTPTASKKHPKKSRSN